MFKEIEMKFKKIAIIGTGGLINLLAPYTSVIDHVDQALTLSGLRIIYDRLDR